MDNRAGEMQVFLRVVEAGSLSQAARQLLMTPSTVSKLIARIEERLGVRLLERSTRRLSLTEEGRIYYERSQALVAAIDDVERELAQGAGHAGGVIRVNASVAFGALYLVPLLPSFWEAYPHIVVDISLSDEIVDLYLDRTDVAFRVGMLQDSSLVSRRIAVARRKIVAAPAYLERAGVPQSIDDLNTHNCLGFNFRQVKPNWALKDGSRTVMRAIRGTLLANNGETVRQMALAGVGLARLGDYHVLADLEAGQLVEVLSDFNGGDDEQIHALHLGGQRMPQRVRAFLDFMVPRIQARLAGR